MRLDSLCFLLWGLTFLAFGCSHTTHSTTTHSTRNGELGEASFYSSHLDGRRTASGEIYRENRFTCAHRSLPFGTRLRVINLENGKSVLVTVNDRGPFVRGRIVDLSRAAARSLDLLERGHVQVRIQRQPP